MRYARIVDNAAVEMRIFPVAPDPNPAKGLDWRPCPVIPKPVFDLTTQVCEGPIYTVASAQVVESWTVRLKTAEELAADLEAARELAVKQAESIKQLFLASFRINNDVRVLKGQAAWTKAEFRQWVKDL